MAGDRMQQLKTRFDNELPRHRVKAFNGSYLMHETKSKLGRNAGWNAILKRNDWFQRKAAQTLMQNVAALEQLVVFSYSYTAKKVFEVAKQAGCQTVLGQIDPGPVEENIVAEEVAQLKGTDTGFVRAPKQYWDDWHAECELADTIVVNSEWSRSALLKEGIDEKKISILPLVYEPSEAAKSFRRTYPESFTKARPLCVLWLGQVIPRKGIHYLIEAAKMLEEKPVLFRVVGNPGPWKSLLGSMKNVELVGQVPRSEVSGMYKSADVFLFPTLSDGFGLTQLEAQSWKLPLICSKFCGRVVRHGENGIELKSVSADRVVESISRVLATPSLLSDWSQQSKPSPFGMPQLVAKLIQLESF